MQAARVDALPYPYLDLGEIQGDSGSILIVDNTQQPNNARQSSTTGRRSKNGSRAGAVLQRQWVTLTAEMWPSDDSNSIGAAPGWKPSANQLPILVGVFCGAALVVAILAACLLYWCCIMPRKESKHFCIRKVDSTVTPTATPVPQMLPPPWPDSTNQSAVFAERKRTGWGYTNRLIAANGPLEPNPWYTSRVIGGPQCTQCPGVCPVPRSNSSHGQCHSGSTSRRPRPVSHPVPSNVSTNGDVLPKQALPDISEFSPNSPPQYASSSILDDYGARDDQGIVPDERTLKTRSLPARVRSKPRPLSTEDDVNDLYAKVNFSKKRKNRMRNDEAAIIALSKSRSQFLHKDTDSLVDNEAVIVYDERTAL